MSTIWPKEIEEILKVGKPLFSFGIKNWALTKAEAIAVIEKLYLSGVSILGGDVYENKGEVFESNYDNWYCDPLPDEEHGAFLDRSIKIAKQYIELYQTKEPDSIFFVLVPNI